MSIHPLTQPEAHGLPKGTEEGKSARAEEAMEEAMGGPRGSRAPIAFSELYEQWFDEVARWIRAMGGPEADRDDLVQEVFIIVHRRLRDFDGTNLAGWLYQIARRKVRDFRRLRWARRIVLLDSDTRADMERVDRSPLVSLEVREKRDLLMRLLEGLNDSERAAVVLFDIEGYSGQRIAELQSVPLNTVWTRIHKARHKLKAGLLAQERAGQKLHGKRGGR